ncbi:MAG: cytidine deaminase [Halobacteriovorax sp.]|nr:cytidine deaminase [Halobacteriovorax sp.]|tara:strand:+ start:114330 stop:114875 length:546 start_codon:yes stop_codon:yes gene_type:complete
MSENVDQNINLIEVKSALNWDEYFMLQAMIASFRSKDPSTKVGAVFVDENNHQVTMGYNGFVAGIDETRLPWGKDSSVGLEHQKYGYVVHAEANAILHAKAPLKNTTAYVTLFPCNECAKLIASSKVREIVFLSDKHADKAHSKIARKIFDLAGIKHRQLPISENLLNSLNDHLKSLLTEL